MGCRRIPPFASAAQATNLFFDSRTCRSLRRNCGSTFLAPPPPPWFVTRDSGPEEVVGGVELGKEEEEE
jgi:hypothetical protein